MSTNIFRAIWNWLIFLISLPFMAGELKTWEDFKEAAYVAILEGKLDEAETLTKQATALKALDTTQGRETCSLTASLPHSLSSCSTT